MRYLFLVYTSEADDVAEGTPERASIMQRYGALSQELREAGVHLGGERLQPIAAATTVRVRDGKTMITDGPFAETKEQLGGYYLLDCKDLDEALAFAAKIPSADYGSIEVRPLMEMA